jgi:hypothetical protein
MASHPPYDSAPPTHVHVSYFDRTGPAKLSTVVAHSLAEVLDIDVTEGEKLLYEAIDPQSLNHLFSRQEDGTARYSGQLSFTAGGCRVVVTAAGRIEIDPTA